MQVGQEEIAILSWLDRVLWTPSAIHSAATDHGELMTLVAGKRQGLLMAGDDDEVYDKKP